MRARSYASFPGTILMGKLADPSALIGVLNSLHDIEYPILSVEYLETGSWRFSLI